MNYTCGNCGSSEMKTKEFNLTEHQKNIINIFNINKYEIIDAGEYTNLYFIDDELITAKDNQDAFQQSKTIAFPICSECFSVMINDSIVKDNIGTILYVSFENGNEKPIYNLINKFKLDIAKPIKCYGGFNYGPLAGIINGTNKNNILQWLMQSELWNTKVATSILEYASSDDFGENKKQFITDTIRLMIDNGADWQSNMPIANFNRIMCVYEKAEQDNDIFMKMLQWHLGRTGFSNW